MEDHSDIAEILGLLPYESFFAVGPLGVGRGRLGLLSEPFHDAADPPSLINIFRSAVRRSQGSMPGTLREPRCRWPRVDRGGGGSGALPVDSAWGRVRGGRIDTIASSGARHETQYTACLLDSPCRSRRMKIASTRNRRRAGEVPRPPRVRIGPFTEWGF